MSNLAQKPFWNFQGFCFYRIWRSWRHFGSSEVWKRLNLPSCLLLSVLSARASSDRAPHAASDRHVWSICSFLGAGERHPSASGVLVQRLPGSGRQLQVQVPPRRRRAHAAAARSLPRGRRRLQLRGQERLWRGDELRRSHRGRYDQEVITARCWNPFSFTFTAFISNQANNWNYIHKTKDTNSVIKYQMK